MIYVDIKPAGFAIPQYTGKRVTVEGTVVGPRSPGDGRGQGSEGGMRLVAVALKNLRRKKIRTSLTVGGVAVAVAVLVSLTGFQEGYQRGLKSDIDKMGYQLLVTAKGCPYEAATLMLKGGSGLRYMEESVYQKIVGDPRVERVTPQAGEHRVRFPRPRRVAAASRSTWASTGPSGT